VGFLYEPFATSEESMIGTLPIGVVVGLVFAYIVAVVCGALTHYILSRRSAKQKNILKSEGGI
jgi:ABC-type sulfate transport system permease component